LTLWSSSYELPITLQELSTIEGVFNTITKLLVLSRQLLNLFLAIGLFLGKYYQNDQCFQYVKNQLETMSKYTCYLQLLLSLNLLPFSYSVDYNAQRMLLVFMLFQI
jgi:hypothetical protein